MRLSEQAMQNRRETIIQTAFKLFCERGIENVPLAEIARRSGVSENTLYRYFANKNKLVLDAFVMLWDTIMKNVDHIVESVPNYDALTGIEQISVWLRGFRRLYQADREFVLFSYEAKLYLLRENIKLSCLQQDTLMQSFRGPCLAALEKGKKDGSIPTTSGCEELFYAIWGAVRGYVVKIVIYGKLYGQDSPWEKHYDMVEKGILSALSSGWGTPQSTS